MLRGRGLWERRELVLLQFSIPTGECPPVDARKVYL